MYLKVREAALHYQISEKTIRKWVKSGKLQATTSIVNGVAQYAILPEDIERVIAEKHIAPVGVSSAEELIASLAQQVQALEQRLTHLESLLQPASRYEETPTKRQSRRESPVEQPPGTISLSTLAQELGIDRRTLLDHLTKHDLQHIAIQNPARPKEHMRYFTDEQATAIKTWHQGRKTPRLWDES